MLVLMMGRCWGGGAWCVPPRPPPWHSPGWSHPGGIRAARRELWPSSLFEQPGSPTCAKLTPSWVLFLRRQHCPPTSRTNKPPFCLLAGKSQGPSQFSLHHSEELQRQLFLTVWGKVAFFSPSCPAFSSGLCLSMPRRSGCSDGPPRAAQQRGHPAASPRCAGEAAVINTQDQ